MLGVDVGGANLKLHHPETGESRSIYTPLWREEGRKRLREELTGAGEVAAVVTGELADCYGTRREGVLAILDLLEEATEEVRVYGYGGLSTPEEVRKDPLAFSGANWVASAALVEEEMGSCVLVDVGTTTTDVVPVTSWRATSDLERLGEGELVYGGAVRTDVSALIDEFRIDGDVIPPARERFALTGDAHRLLGHLDEGEYIDPPNGRGASVEECASRLARTVCSDLEELPIDEVEKMASQVFEEQVEEIAEALEVQSRREGSDRTAVCGTGDFLAREAARRAGTEIIELKELFGEAAETLPAYAVSTLASSRSSR